jgi:hypothetical protein
MALNQDIGSSAKKLLLPAAATIAGAGAGLALTKKSVRKALPDLGDRGIGDIADDLRSKLDSAIGKVQPSSSQSHGRHIDSQELHQRRREREQRRSSRRARS